jgi:hypothetical protein
MDWWCGSGIAPALQVQSPESKPQTPVPPKKKKRESRLSPNAGGEDVVESLALSPKVCIYFDHKFHI